MNLPRPLLRPPEDTWFFPGTSSWPSRWQRCGQASGQHQGLCWPPPVRRRTCPHARRSSRSGLCPAGSGRHGNTLDESCSVPLSSIDAGSWRAAGVSRFGEADRVRRPRRTDIDAAAESGTINRRGRWHHAARVACQESLADRWPAVPGPTRARPGLPRQRPSAGVGQRRAQRAALDQIRLNSATFGIDWDRLDRSQYPDAGAVVGGGELVVLLTARRGEQSVDLASICALVAWQWLLIPLHLWSWRL